VTLARSPCRDGGREGLDRCSLTRNKKSRTNQRPRVKWPFPRTKIQVFLTKFDGNHSHTCPLVT
jgi:hypothetical protein